jgi:hypothetical protein
LGESYELHSTIYVCISLVIIHIITGTYEDD